MKTPIYKRLCDYRNDNRIPFAMPGHKNMRGLDADFTGCDVTELSKTLNLMGDDETVSCANELLSSFYGSEKSFILTCGSTSCVQAMVLSTLSHGDTLLASRDCHISVINICAVAGIKIKLTDNISESDFTDGVRAVLVTSPNYYGVIKDIKKISELCHKNGAVLLVDEAHGAHFTNRYGLPETAVRLGADMVCHSAHKTLNALTGAAYLHVASDRVDINRVKRAIRMLHTTSPSYMIAASADIARATLEEQDYTDIIKECNEFKDAISEAGVRFLPNDDPTRLVLDFSEYGVTGFEIAERLSQNYGIDVEMADLIHIVLIVTPYNRHSDFISLFHSLKDIISGLEKGTDKKVYPKIPEVSGEVISPQDGWGIKTELVDVKKAIGRVSAQTLSVYPPGTAVTVMGEKVSNNAVEYISAVTEYGGEVIGLNDGKIEVIL